VNIQTGDSINEVIHTVASTTNDVIQWFQDSGLAVNQRKTEVCIFSRKNCEDIPNNITIGDSQIKIAPDMKVLGITFDQKLSWNQHLHLAINKALRVKRGIGLLAKYLSTSELQKLAVTLFYSRLYYGAEVWLHQALTSENSRKLSSASNAMLRIVSKTKKQQLPTIKLHKSLNQPTPKMWANYSDAKALYNVTTTTIPDSLLPTLTYNRLENKRFKGLTFTSSERTKIGSNSLANRVSEVSKIMDEDWSTMTKEQFKRFAKKKFLTEPPMTN
jgi:hypothetical protein